LNIPWQITADDAPAPQHFYMLCIVAMQAALCQGAELAPAFNDHHKRNQSVPAQHSFMLITTCRPPLAYCVNSTKKLQGA
jgi:hypothetical protein